MTERMLPGKGEGRGGEEDKREATEDLDRLRTLLCSSGG